MVVLLNYSGHAAGAVVFDGGNPNGLVAGPIVTFTLADDFVLSATATVTGSEFWTLNRPASRWNGEFSWFVIIDEGLGPASTPFLTGDGDNATAIATGRTFGPVDDLKDEFYWSFRFPEPILLQARTVYWLGITIEEDAVGVGPQGIFWEAADSAFGASVRRADYIHSTNSFINWTELTPARSAAFRLDGSPIPEPCTLIIWSLLGALAFTVGWWPRRRAA